MTRPYDLNPDAEEKSAAESNALEDTAAGTREEEKKTTAAELPLSPYASNHGFWVKE